MNANELADNLIPFATDYKISNLDCMILSDAITMLRQQQAEIDSLKRQLAQAQRVYDFDNPLLDKGQEK